MQYFRSEKYEPLMSKVETKIELDYTPKSCILYIIAYFWVYRFEMVLLFAIEC